MRCSNDVARSFKPISNAACACTAGAGTGAGGTIGGGGTAACAVACALAFAGGNTGVVFCEVAGGTTAGCAGTVAVASGVLEIPLGDSRTVGETPKGVTVDKPALHSAAAALEHVVSSSKYGMYPLTTMVATVLSGKS